ncbi:HBR099Cp [Eremothecium sinecaudum]|uniref:glucan endo-1,3-beta-D-glucosidase n=1 Tax=Eremothecium sinecaudum TaxID=45286 RepID=A0A125RDZ6_9SACH|nr:HBR099Cp [Eremothecium sinecaudum]AMD19000.1 HBR099Cp [Eremothecium sinecaudum]
MCLDRKKVSDIEYIKQSRMPPPFTEFMSEDRDVEASDNVPPPLPPRNYPSMETNVEIDITMVARLKLQPGPNEFDPNTNFIPPCSTPMANIFASPISTDAPLSLFTKKSHPVPLPGILNNKNKPVETNKFYGNMLVDDQNTPVWTHPYSLWISRSDVLGMAVNHVKESQRVFDDRNTPPRYFYGPVYISSIVFGCTDFQSRKDMKITVVNPRQLSVEMRLGRSEEEYIQFPLVQGMGLITAVYYNLIPRLSSRVGFRSIEGQTSPRSGINKYKIVLNNHVTWTLYVSNPSGKSTRLALQDGDIVSDKSVYGCVFQVIPETDPVVDSVAGCYITSVDFSGSVDGNRGNYTFKYNTAGSSNSGNPLIYALPHQYQNFTLRTTGKTNLKLESVVKGMMQGYITKVFDINVEVHSDLGFDPYTTIPGKNPPRYSNDVLNAIRKAASSEVDDNVLHETDLDSMYFAGKALAKYAWILYCCQFILHDQKLVSNLMPKLKEALRRFITNKQKLPLVYDTTWGGLISSGNEHQDFGNSNYNDHHFHYGYHVIACAIVAKVDREAGDGKWLGENKAWVENLIRDYANPSTEDKYFPVFRSFDWFNGHSWAKGLFHSNDGKDQESSSEDVNASYALKLWGLVTGNKNLAKIGDLMIGVLRTSSQNYFLYTSDNTTEPHQFIPNKVSGILFENKIDHTTYFGKLPQFVHGIHQIPIIPASSIVRSPKFVAEEWHDKVASFIDKVDDGWRGVLMLNLALTDPKESFKFFSSPDFNNKYLDDGQSKTWSLAYSGAFSS